MRVASSGYGYFGVFGIENHHTASAFHLAYPGDVHPTLTGSLKHRASQLGSSREQKLVVVTPTEYRFCKA